MKKARKPAVAGLFYPQNPPLLLSQIEGCFSQGPGKIKLLKKKLSKPLGLIIPHAGYPYSGVIAAYGFYHLAKLGRPDGIVIIGPNHTTAGAAISIATEGIWETPLGEVAVDEELAGQIESKSARIVKNEEAFRKEHSIEVQLPFLQYLFDDFNFVPISCLDQGMEAMRELGEAVVDAVSKSALIIVSSDFTHFAPHDIASELDLKAIEAIKKLDFEGFYDVVKRFSISICGWGAIAALITIAKSLSLEKVRLLKYGTSGDVTGDKASVVGYAAISFEEVR